MEVVYSKGFRFGTKTSYPSSWSDNYDMFRLNNASGVFNLPLAASVNKPIFIVHIGTSLTQVYTITCAGSDVFNLPGTPTTRKMHTKGQVLGLMPDRSGGGWIVFHSYTDTEATAYTPTISAGFGTATGVAGTWWRRGDRMKILVSFTSGTVAASLGTCTLPSGATIDANKLTITGNTSAQPGNVVGMWTPNVASPQRNAALTAPGTSTTLIYMGSNATPLTPSNGTTTASTTVHSLEAEFPVTDWVA